MVGAWVRGVASATRRAEQYFKGRVSAAAGNRHHGLFQSCWYQRTLDFVSARDNVVFLGPPGTGKTHLAIGIAIRACQAGHRVLFATAAEWVPRLAEAHHAGRLQQELVRLGRYPLLVVERWAKSRSNPKPPTCSSSCCLPATSGQA